jgi:hypothetical protein
MSSLVLWSSTKCARVSRLCTCSARTTTSCCCCCCFVSLLVSSQSAPPIIRTTTERKGLYRMGDGMVSMVWEAWPSSQTQRGKNSTNLFWPKDRRMPKRAPLLVLRGRTTADVFTLLERYVWCEENLSQNQYANHSSRPRHTKTRNATKKTTTI